MLDLAALNDLRDEQGSLFDEAYRHRMKRAHFVRGLSWRISKPIMPNDQPIEYLPTQAIADFLATAEYPPLPLDGIVYPSVQAGYPSPFARAKYLAFGHRKEHFNVVLFDKAARVQGLDESADISVSDNSFFPFSESSPLVDSPDVQYTVWVTSDAEDPTPANNSQDDAALRYQSLEVRYVKSVNFDTVSSSIPRFSKEKSEG